MSWECWCAENVFGAGETTFPGSQDRCKGCGRARADAIDRDVARTALQQVFSYGRGPAKITIGLMQRATPNNVDHPPHYNFGKIEVITAIDDWSLGFSLGNAVKYIARAKHKGSELECLSKARWYLNHEIERLEKLAAASAVPDNESPSG